MSVWKNSILSYYTALAWKAEHSLCTGLQAIPIVHSLSASWLAVDLPNRNGGWGCRCSHPSSPSSSRKGLIYQYIFTFQQKEMWQPDLTFQHSDPRGRQFDSLTSCFGSGKGREVTWPLLTAFPLTTCRPQDGHNSPNQLQCLPSSKYSQKGFLKWIITAHSSGVKHVCFSF